MDKNYYEILGFNSEEIAYFLNYNEETNFLNKVENSIKIKDEMIANAFEKKKKEITEKRNFDLEKVDKLMELKQGLVDIGKKMNKVDDNDQRIRKGIETAKIQDEIARDSINKQYEIHINQLELAYNQLKTEELRKVYNEQISMESNNDEIKKITEDIEKKYRIEKFNKQDKYNPDLLKTIDEGNFGGEKAVIRKSTKDPIEISLNDDRNMEIIHSATVFYKNATDVLNSYVNEYEITRTVDGKQKKDIVYTEIDLLRLGFNKKRNMLVDPNYYECVVNKLFSEEAIEGSKFNGGYIGLLEQLPDGKYDITLNKEGELSVEEQENLAAVMVLKERKDREEIKNKNEQEKEGEDR